MAAAPAASAPRPSTRPRRGERPRACPPGPSSEAGEVTIHEGDATWHDGPGWYYTIDDYPDEGSCGAFSSRWFAEEHARQQGNTVPTTCTTGEDLDQDGQGLDPRTPEYGVGGVGGEETAIVAVDPPPTNTLRAMRLCERCERPLVDHDDGACPEVTAGLLTDNMFIALSRTILEEIKTLDGRQWQDAQDLRDACRIGRVHNDWGARYRVAAAINARAKGRR